MIFKKTYTIEACLSFPGKQVRTQRFKHVTIESDNLGIVSFGPTGTSDGNYSDKQQLQLLESICIQHELDHLDGITMLDRVGTFTARYAQDKARKRLKAVSRGKPVKPKFAL